MEKINLFKEKRIIITILFLVLFFSFLQLTNSSQTNAASRTHTSDRSALVNATTIGKSKSIEQAVYVGCLISTVQKLYCSGYNGFGQLGNSTNISTTLPVLFAPPGNKLFTDVSLSANHYVCALTTDQLAYCSGYNNHGQLGDGSLVDKNIPTLFQLPAGKKAAKVITNNSNFNSCVLTVDGLVYCAGINDNGQIGDGNSSTADRPTPSLFQLPAGKYAASISTNNLYNTCAVTIEQQLYCSGLNHVNQLTDADTATRFTPEPLTPPTGEVVSVGVGFYHVCALTTDQKVYCRGYNVYGQLGNGVTGLSSPFVEFNLGGKKAAKVIAGGYHTCVLTTDQLLYCAGYNVFGQIGNGTNIDQPTPVQFNVSGKTITSVSAKYYHTCALTSDQLVYCAGYNIYGALGNGTTADQPTPVIFNLSGQKASIISTDVYHTCAITVDQDAYCAGFGAYGSLANNPAVLSQPTPVKFNWP